MLLLGVGMALMIPSSALGARSVGYQYLTTYSGTYTFSDSYQARPVAPDGLETRQQYEWLTYDYETIVVAPDHTYTRTLTSYILARGTLRSVEVQGSGVTGGPFTSTTSCQIYSDPTPIVISGGGDYIEPVLAKQNPLLELGWMLPDHGTTPSRYLPRFHESGTADCTSGSSWLAWSPSSGIGTVFAALPLTRAMRTAFSGGATIHYAAIRKRPWTRSFKVTAQDRATRPGFTGPSVDSAKVVVNSRVQFERTSGDTLPKAPPRTQNKLVDLLINEGFLGLQAQGPQGGPPVGAGGDPDTVVIPGFGAGEVSLDVTGPWWAGARAMRRPADLCSPLPGPPCASGGAPVRLTIVPTSAGARLLKAPHGAFSARYVLSYHPAGSRRTYSGVRVWAVPARP